MIGQLSGGMVARAALAAAILLTALAGGFFCGALGAFIEDTGEDW